MKHQEACSTITCAWEITVIEIVRSNSVRCDRDILTSVIQWIVTGPLLTQSSASDAVTSADVDW